eukprot:10523843-Alexandrium_andersonii.AAC.1
MTGRYERDAATSWWFERQPGLDLSAFVHFHYLSVPDRRRVAAMGPLPGPRHAASLMHNIGLVQDSHGLAPA